MVLELFNKKPAEVDSALRISFCSDNTEEDIAALVQGLKDAQKAQKPRYGRTAGNSRRKYMAKAVILAENGEMPL